MYQESSTNVWDDTLSDAALEAQRAENAEYIEEYAWLRNKVQVQAAKHQRNLAIAMLETWIQRATGRASMPMTEEMHPHAALRKMN